MPGQGVPGLFQHRLEARVEQVESSEEAPDVRFGTAANGVVAAGFPPSLDGSGQ
jgi:hypothetical protein